MLVTSAEAAQRLGVPRDNWVFRTRAPKPRTPTTSANRQDLHRSPAIRRGGQGTLPLTDPEVDTIDHIDLYSCFPSAVQVAATELGLPRPTPRVR